MNKQPSTNGSNGRNQSGQFNTGNKYGRGNPFARQCAALRAAFMNALSIEDIAEIAQHLVQRSREGDLVAIKLILGYCLGAPGTAPATDRSESDEMEAESKRIKVAKSLELERMMY